MSKISATIDKVSFDQQIEFNSYNDLSVKILNWIDTKVSILSDNEFTGKEFRNDQITNYTNAKLLYLNAEYDKSLKLLENSQIDSILLRSRALLELGKNDLSNTKKSEFDWLNPDDIESINVLKGKAAEKKYGEKGKDGIVEIITKKE